MVEILGIVWQPALYRVEFFFISKYYLFDYSLLCYIIHHILNVFPY